MWRVTIKGLLAHKLRLVLTALAIVLGVTFIAGTFVLTDTLHSTFDTLFSNIYQNVDFQVRGVAQLGSGGGATRNPVPESLLATVRAVPGVEVAEGTVAGTAQFISHDGTAISTGGAPTLGVSWDPAQQLSPLRLAAGGPPTTPHDVVMDLGTAKKYGFSVGQQVRILLRGPTQTFTISGLTRFGTANNLAGAHAGRLRAADGAEDPGRGRQVRRHQRRRPARCRQVAGPAGHRQRPAPGRRGGDRPDGHQRADESGEPGPGLLQHGVAGVRLHRAVRRRLHHLEHVLHHRGTAHA